MVLIAALFYLSLTPLLLKGLSAKHLDKLYHTTHYALIMAWFVQIYRGTRSYLLLATGFILMGAVVEIIQGFQPLRYLDLLDMLANALGVALVLCCARGRFITFLERVEKTLPRLLRSH